VRVLLGAPVGVRQSGLGQHLGDILGSAWTAVGLQGFLDLVADLPDRIEVGHRVLGHHADGVAAQFDHPLFGRVRDVFAVQQDLSPRDPAVGGQQADRSEGGC
jgi:hypothetical protein